MNKLFFFNSRVALKKDSRDLISPAILLYFDEHILLELNVYNNGKLALSRYRLERK
jgi:hypothetical protein